MLGVDFARTTPSESVQLALDGRTHVFRSLTGPGLRTGGLALTIWILAIGALATTAGAQVESGVRYEGVYAPRPIPLTSEAGLSVEAP